MLCRLPSQECSMGVGLLWRVNQKTIESYQIAATIADSNSISIDIQYNHFHAIYFNSQQAHSSASNAQVRTEV
jgi:hemolysin activation/secretion protein